MPWVGFQSCPPTLGCLSLLSFLHCPSSMFPHAPLCTTLGSITEAHPPGASTPFHELRGVFGLSDSSERCTYKAIYFFLLFKKKFANVDCIPKHNFSACQATKSLSFYFCLPRTPPLHQWPRKKILTCHIHSTYIYIALHFKKEDCYSLFPFQANPLAGPKFLHYPISCLDA